MEGSPKNKENRESSIRKLDSIIQSYSALTAEIRLVVGDGEGATHRESYAERRAGVQKRALLNSFLENFPDKEKLPEFIHYKNDFSAGLPNTKYLFPRTNEIYTVVSEDRNSNNDLSFTPEWEKPNKDPSFVPESGTFRGSETIRHLILQNKEQSLRGIALRSAKPRFGAERALDEDIHEYANQENVSNEDLKIILAGLKSKIESSEEQKLFEELVNTFMKIDEDAQREQEMSVEKYAEQLKEKFKEWVATIEEVLHISVPKRIFLLSEDHFELEEKMKKFGRELKEERAKKGMSIARAEEKELSQEYFYPHNPKLEFVPVKKGKITRKWKEETDRTREATPQEFIRERMYIKQKLWDMIPDEIRSNLKYP